MPSVILFSKDRPYQLYCALDTLVRTFCDYDVLHVFIIVKDSAVSSAGYRVLAERYISEKFDVSMNVGIKFHWIMEVDSISAGKLDFLLMGVFDQISELEGRDATVCLTVDDSLWIENVSVASCAGLLRKKDIFGVQCKLSPRIEYAQTCDQMMRLPALSFVSSDLEGFLEYAIGHGDLDWNYPWDLSGTFYRLSDIRRVVETVVAEFGPDLRPNVLEARGIHLMAKGVIEVPQKCVALAHPAVVVLTVNRVQEVFKNPVYADEVMTVNRLLEDWNRVSLDERPPLLADPERYRDPESLIRGRSWASFRKAEFLEGIIDVALHFVSLNALDCVHVPCLPESASKLCIEDLGITDVLVSWVVPVRNCRAYLPRLVAAILRAEFHPSLWECVFVDDGSTDGSYEFIQSLSLRDPRFRLLSTVEHERHQGCRSQEDLQGKGVASALNLGLQAAEGMFLARIDADDIPLPSRLLLQVGYLLANPDVDVLGGAFRTFRQSSSYFCSHCASLEQFLRDYRCPQSPPSPLPLCDCYEVNPRLYRMVCSPGMVEWNMLFSCSLAHPTVMLRASALKGAEEKNEGEGAACRYPDVCAEDHSLWLRMLGNSKKKFRFANLPSVVSFLMRRPEGVSATWGDALAESSFSSVRSFLKPYGLSEEELGLILGKEVSRASPVVDSRKIEACLESLMVFFEGRAREKRKSGFRRYLERWSQDLKSSCAFSALARGDVTLGSAFLKTLLGGEVQEGLQERLKGFLKSN